MLLYMTLKCGRRDVGILAMEFWQAGGGYCWHERKLVEESKLAECFAILENGLRTERDIACFEALKAAGGNFQSSKTRSRSGCLKGSLRRLSRRWPITVVNGLSKRWTWLWNGWSIKFKIMKKDMFTSVVFYWIFEVRFVMI